MPFARLSDARNEEADLYVPEDEEEGPFLLGNAPIELKISEISAQWPLDGIGWPSIGMMVRPFFRSSITDTYDGASPSPPEPAREDADALKP